MVKGGQDGSAVLITSHSTGDRLMLVQTSCAVSHAPSYDARVGIISAAPCWTRRTNLIIEKSRTPYVSSATHSPIRVREKHKVDGQDKDHRIDAHHQEETRHREAVYYSRSHRTFDTRVWALRLFRQRRKMRSLVAFFRTKKCPVPIVSEASTARYLHRVFLSLLPATSMHTYEDG